MIRLFVNVDHVATVREARKTIEPSPLKAALLAERAGAQGITIHLREDRRHIQDEDVRVVQKGINTKLNLEMAPTQEMVDLALEIRPYQISLVPEKRQEITTEGGLDVCSQEKELSGLREKMHGKGILFSLFIDPDLAQIDACKRIQADSVEINTGKYTELESPQEIARELERIQKSAARAAEQGLKVFAGHGLNYENVEAIAAIPEIEELNIGHFIVGQAIYEGMENAVTAMIRSIARGRGQQS
ncbi:MAG: pyridoxine 5'-phosphate synthase [Nitrospina sp.]|jgi:pyridoxine 5-phosphate synthase|nr:pyridoxine 5'-phosphate synthase [Nitrospina sp.]MBT3414713.1 pyridoxine 5'-phosphate synthase [Nitrospina sp.]MBT3857363.1 pyridoxine 5'-phosphate synthase [Nitrospina sp.]MBT4103906.1 pyridoxine 5'-phosphate synthase [Nitrospina sp.]MBT4388923.1 pyridoxine 5'-phosphate synthase [Nitrospina sp.]